MKSKIKQLSRTEQQVNLTFEIDSRIIRSIEKTLQKLNPGFKLSNYKKRYGNKILENFWELNKKGENFNFTLVVRRDVLRLKLKSDSIFINKFLKTLGEYTEFSKLSPKIKAKLERRGVKGEWYGS
ncbi:MAG: hypothetical protein Q7S06_01025 [Nanoarchaeota archaeon]|nr:hypothetical protein [Nanoarchaeota archaeon]